MRLYTKLLAALALSLLLVFALRVPGKASRTFAAEQQAPGQAKPAPPAANDPTAGVEVTAQPLPANKFCEFGPKAYVVYLPLDVTVANGRRTPIILSRYLHIQRILVGKNTADVQAQKYELSTKVRPFRSFGEGVKHIRHPILGPLAFEYSAFAVDGRPDLSMVVYNPATPADAERITSLMEARSVDDPRVL